MLEDIRQRQLAQKRAEAAATLPQPLSADWLSSGFQKVSGKELDGIQQQLVSAVKENPNQSRAYLYLAMISARQNLPDQARLYLGRAFLTGNLNGAELKQAGRMFVGFDQTYQVRHLHPSLSSSTPTYYTGQINFDPAVIRYRSDEKGEPPASFEFKGLKSIRFKPSEMEIILVGGKTYSFEFPDPADFRLVQNLLVYGFNLKMSSGVPG